MLKELIDKFYLDRQKNKEQYRFYITDAGKCSRAVFFNFKNVPKEKIDPRMLRLFDRGDYLQMQILNSLFSMGLVRASEIGIPSQELISGRADAIITLNNELYVVDFKSMNSMIFKKLTKPKEENVNQIQLYMHFFKIPKGILLYISKDDLDLKEFLIKYDKNRAEKLLKNLSDLKIKIDNNIVPAIILKSKTNWQCKYCQFKEICKIAGQKDIKWQNFKEKISLDTT
jgi:CRISPR/Cas system-associated exonuclease Cas4 (RecB family)